MLRSAPIENEYHISDLFVDDFFMFRYELQTINKKHTFADEKADGSQMFGRHPLSTYEGVPIKDVLKDLNRGEAYKNREKDREELQKKL